MKTMIIPAAGRGSRMMALTDYYPKAMMPFDNKPIIHHQIEQAIGNNYDVIVIVVGYRGYVIIDYVETHFSDVDIRFIEQRTLSGLSSGVLLGLSTLLDDELALTTVSIQLSDVLIDYYEYSPDSVLVSSVDDWSRWCMAVVDDSMNVSKLIDKPKEKPDTNHNLIGFYNFSQADKLKEALEVSIFNHNSKGLPGENQISEAINAYVSITEEQIAAHYVAPEDYHDLGEADALNFISDNVSRSFNNIKINEEGLIEKTSKERANKTAREYNWYNTVPENIKKYLPQVFEQIKYGYVMERVPFTQLQDMMMFKHTTFNQWQSVFNAIGNYLSTAKEEGIGVTPSIRRDNSYMLIQKTWDRVEDLTELFPYKTYTINSIIYENPLYHMDEIMKKVVDMLAHTKSDDVNAIIHGDLFFGNMMFDEVTNRLVLIDPRGSYGQNQLFGDIRYDLAKLNHSIEGQYDFIVNDLFTVNADYSNIDYTIYSGNLDEMHYLYNQMIESLGFSKFYDDINLITGLLFLTMLPLHEDSYEHQIVQFAKASEFLNEYIYGENK